MDTAFPPVDPIVAPGMFLPDPGPLRRLSDYVYIVWKESCGDRPTKDARNKCKQGLKWIIHQNVKARPIEAIVRILQANGRLVNNPWPGLQMDWFDQGALAVIGSPNGWSVIYMLGQHYSVLGERRIRQVYLFLNDNGGLNLAFRLT